VEAADDICYNIIDLEDAHRLRILSYEEVERLLIPLCGDSGIRARLDSLADLDSRISLLRAKAINSLILACAGVFMEKHQKIMVGNFDEVMIDGNDPKLQKAMKQIMDNSVEQIDDDAAVIQIEVAGYKVMTGLLEEFIQAYLHDYRST